jgi:NAD(P)-dependent dehydrogenase (short-subunit alcohol dehydrogenase family)
MCGMTRPSVTLRPGLMCLMSSPSARVGSSGGKNTSRTSSWISSATSGRPMRPSAFESARRVPHKYRFAMYSYFSAPQVPAYAAAKTAVVSLTKSLAISFAGDGIRVNAIVPGWIKTEISRVGRENPEFNTKVVARLRGGEWAELEEPAGTAIFLASAASRLITGVTIPVDGDYTAG